MKKSIFIISFILVALFFSFSYVLATNDGNTMINNVRNTIGGAENVVENTANDITGAVKNGFNTVGDKTENAVNDVTNAGDNMMNNTNDNTNYTATRTATDTTTNTDTNTTDMANNVWTWIIVAIIAITIIALIWYYTTRSNH